MKAVFVALSLILVVAAADERFRRGLITKCTKEADCGANRCCLFGKLCTPKLPKYSTCHLMSKTKCGCADGLECRVTKEFNILGQTIRFRQCMEIGSSPVVEKLEDEEVKEIMERGRAKRFLIDTCSTEADCGAGRCCLFNKICAKKIPKDMTCYLTNKHKCGCADGLECQVTTTIVIPIVGSKIPIRQCVPKA